MLLLFVGGVMNLWWIGALTIFVLIKTRAAGSARRASFRSAAGGDGPVEPGVKVGSKGIPHNREFILMEFLFVLEDGRSLRLKASPSAVVLVVTPALNVFGRTVRPSGAAAPPYISTGGDVP